MKTDELQIFRMWIRAEIAASERPMYQTRQQAEILFQQLLKMCEDVKPEDLKQ